MINNNMEILVNQENCPEAEEIVDFFKTLNSFERREFIGIMRGARLVKTCKNRAK